MKICAKDSDKSKKQLMLWKESKETKSGGLFRSCERIEAKSPENPIQPHFRNNSRGSLRAKIVKTFKTKVYWGENLPKGVKPEAKAKPEVTVHRWREKDVQKPNRILNFAESLQASSFRTRSIGLGSRFTQARPITENQIRGQHVRNSSTSS